MTTCETLVRHARVIDGTGAAPFVADVAISDGTIARVAPGIAMSAEHEIDAAGLCLAPGFIDVHTHDDTNVVRTPEMWPKLSQGVTTVVVGNCGISAAPARLRDGALPVPLALLGDAGAFVYPNFRAYVDAIARVQPAVNVAALVGHTTLRNNQMDALDRAATAGE